MSKNQIAKMSEQDWENLRLQLKTLVDIYCELNNDVVKIKDLLKKIVKELCKKKKKYLPTRKKISKKR